VLGSAAAGALLAPETVRRLACDAAVVPAVLGSHGELVELGRRARLFTEGQLRALWLRDRGCSFPGCTVPAAWADAHHLWHWTDGGPTNLANGALLCGRHHDLVHAKGFHGQLVDGAVAWDLTPGAYDHWLRHRQATAADTKAARASEPADPKAAPDPPAPDPPAPDFTAAGSAATDSAAPPERTYDLWGEPQTRAGDPPPPPWRP
jgi:hypothetical protein